MRKARPKVMKKAHKAIKRARRDEMNKQILADQLVGLLPCHPLGEAIGGDYEVKEGGITSYFAKINRDPKSKDYKVLFTANFHAYKGGPRQGSMVYRVCMHSMTTLCHECFAFFAIELASKVGGALLSVSSSDDKTHKTICALYQFPITICALDSEPCEVVP